MIQRCLRSGDNIVCHTAIPALEYMVKYIYEILLDGLNGLMANRKVANIAGLQNPTCLDSPPGDLVVAHTLLPLEIISCSGLARLTIRANSITSWEAELLNLQSWHSPGVVPYCRRLSQKRTCISSDLCLS